MSSGSKEKEEKKRMEMSKWIISVERVGPFAPDQMHP